MTLSEEIRVRHSSKTFRHSNTLRGHSLETLWILELCTLQKQAAWSFYWAPTRLTAHTGEAPSLNVVSKVLTSHIVATLCHDTHNLGVGVGQVATGIGLGEHWRKLQDPKIGLSTATGKFSSGKVRISISPESAVNSLNQPENHLMSTKQPTNQASANSVGTTSANPPALHALQEAPQSAPRAWHELLADQFWQHGGFSK